jgi:hypothetical protein
VETGNRRKAKAQITKYLDEAVRALNQYAKAYGDADAHTLAKVIYTAAALRLENDGEGLELLCRAARVRGKTLPTPVLWRRSDEAEHLRSWVAERVRTNPLKDTDDLFFAREYHQEVQSKAPQLYALRTRSQLNAFMDIGFENQRLKDAFAELVIASSGSNRSLGEAAQLFVHKSLLSIGVPLNVTRGLFDARRKRSERKKGR